jgi:3-dehydroquinate dehydratase/shikimate dehydrogenase
MICISLALESRRMALADMLTAARQGDLLEVRLDRFLMAPDVGELLGARRKPIILSCRRRQDGGEWDGSEEERLALLRQCAVSQAPDVVKLVTPARTPEEAWPLLRVLAKPAVPTVVVGLGSSGIMLSVFGKKIGSPWTYAALGKGMETYPGQPASPPYAS